MWDAYDLVLRIILKLFLSLFFQNCSKFLFGCTFLLFKVETAMLQVGDKLTH